MGWFGLVWGVERGGGCGLMGCGCGGVRLWIFGGSELAAGASSGTTEMGVYNAYYGAENTGYFITSVYMGV
jgi:hypothetical protein